MADQTVTKGATEAHLISHAGAPPDTRPWLDDRCLLGVCVERIELRGARQMQEMSVDHPGLTQGWWAAEQTGTALRRWTNSDAVLHLPASNGPTMLERCMSA